MVVLRFIDTTYAHNNGLNTVVGNPGDPTNSSYVGTVDIITPYEGGGLPAASTISKDTINGKNFPVTVSSQWGIFAYNVTSTQLSQTYVNGAVDYIGWIYVTSAAGPPSNPWDVLPTYLSTEVDYLSNT